MAAFPSKHARFGRLPADAGAGSGAGLVSRQPCCAGRISGCLLERFGRISGCLLERFGRGAAPAAGRPPVVAVPYQAARASASRSDRSGSRGTDAADPDTERLGSGWTMAGDIFSINCVLFHTPSLAKAELCEEAEDLQKTEPLRRRPEGRPSLSDTSLGSLCELSFWRW